MTGDAGAGGTVAEIQRGQAGVVGGVDQLVGWPHRLVADVDQIAEQLDVADAVALGQGDCRTPHTALRVAAHALGSQQIAGVADASLDAGASRPVGQPAVDLPDVVIESVANRLVRVAERGGADDSQVELVPWRVAFDSQEVDLPGFQGPVDRDPVLFFLLVHPFVGVFPLGVLVAQGQQRSRDGDGLVDRNGVTADSGGDQLVGNRETRGQQSRLVPGELEAEPVVTAATDPAVVVILDVVRSPDNSQRVVLGALLQRQWLGLFGCVIGFGLDEQVTTGGTGIDVTDLDGHSHGVVSRPGHLPGCRATEWRLPRFAPTSPVEQRYRVLFGRDFQAVGSGDRRTVHGEHVGIEGVEKFRPVGGGICVNPLGGLLAGRFLLRRFRGLRRGVGLVECPLGRQPAVGWQS